MRTAAEKLKELIRKNTLNPTNKCEFDKTVKDKLAEQFAKRFKLRSAE